MSYAQRWKVTVGSDGFCTIVNANSGKALDVASASTVPGTNVQQWASNGTAAQKWKITGDASNGYTLTSALSSSLVLDIDGAQASPGANVQI